MKKTIITAGVDEVGRGCLAGPVVSAAVILKESINLGFLKDSKKISFKKRQKISEHIKSHSIYAVGLASVDEIFDLNILQASLLSMNSQTPSEHKASATKSYFSFKLIHFTSGISVIPASLWPITSILRCVTSSLSLRSVILCIFQNR